MQAKLIVLNRSIQGRNEPALISNVIGSSFICRSIYSIVSKVQNHLAIFQGRPGPLKEYSLL